LDDIVGARLLIVDDNNRSAEITKRFLEREGFEIDRAEDIEDALVRLTVSKPPFVGVIIDLSDSGTTNSQRLLEQIRTNRDPEIAPIPVVICTRVDSNRLFSWQSGVDGFLVQPFHVDELLDTLRGALTRSTEERQAYREEQADLVGNT
jgi:DNA-binding response OmpR family regulator